MPWKKDDKNNLVVDENGNPVWTTEAGEDKPVDYAALAKRLSEVNAESKGRKEELRKSAERYARLKDIEDVSAWYDEALKAMDAVKNMTDKEKDMAAQFQARLDAAIAPKDKTIAERDQTIAEQKAIISGMKIQADVMDSKTLERVKPETRPFLQRELISTQAKRDSSGVPITGAWGSQGSSLSPVFQPVGTGDTAMVSAASFTPTMRKSWLEFAMAFCQTSFITLE